MPRCNKCKDTKEIQIEKATHFDRMPCTECQPPLKSCDGNKTHVLISGYFFTCPVCERDRRIVELQKLLRAYREAETPNRWTQPKVTIAEEIKGEPI